MRFINISTVLRISILIDWSIFTYSFIYYCFFFIFETWLMQKPLSLSANVGARLLDAPHCVLFGILMIWFAAITVNLGPTFITGALANHVETTPSSPSCPLIQTPYRHYIVNLLWVLVNSLCLVLTVTHLYRLHRDLIRSRCQAIRAPE